MDPFTLILSTLAAGASAVVKDTSDQAVKDAYSALKALIQHRFAGKPVAETALTQYQTDPKTWKDPLRKELEQAEAASDPAIVTAAKNLQKTLQEAGVSVLASGQGAVSIGGDVSGSVISTGDHTTVQR